jgi:hypothetical protein
LIEYRAKWHRDHRTERNIANNIRSKASRKKNPDNSRRKARARYFAKLEKVIHDRPPLCKCGAPLKLFLDGRPQKTCGKDKCRTKRLPAVRKIYYESYVKKNRFKINKRDRARRQRDREKLKEKFAKSIAILDDAYVKRLIRKYSPVSLKRIPRALIEAKRMQMAVKRLIKENRHDNGNR